MFARSSITPMLLVAHGAEGERSRGQNDLLGNPYPERLSAREEDGFFKVEARAVLKEEGSSFLKSAAFPKIKSA